jgi:hypothetical protein
MSFTIHTGYALAFSTPVAARAYLRAAPIMCSAQIRMAQRAGSNGSGFTLEKGL